MNNRNNMKSANYQSNLKNLRGTLAIEGMNISPETLSDLELLASGKSSCSEIVEKIKQKYS